MWKSRFQNFHCCERKNICTFIFYIREANVWICTENVWEDVEQIELLSLGIGIGKEEGCIKVSFLVYTFIHSFSKYWLNFYYVAAMALQMRPLLGVEGEADDKKKNYINEQHNFRHNFNTLRSMQKKMGWYDG